MFVVHLCLTVAFENRAKVVEAVQSITGPTLVQLGCRKFCLYSDVNNDDVLILLEMWDSREALYKHIRSDDFRIILSLMDSAVEPPDFAIHDVSNTNGMEFVEQLLN